MIDVFTKRGNAFMADQRHIDKLKGGVNVWNQWRGKHPEIMPDLRNADLQAAMLTGIDFRRTNLDGANLSHARLDSTLLNAASLSQTNLSNTRLRNSNLHKTCFKEAILHRTNMYHASLLDTAFLNIDLSETINLENVFHLGPSTISMDTIQRSKGKIPDIFLLGTGISEQLLTAIRASGHTHFQYFTCFISYSTKDKHFVEILYQDLRKAGVLCWYAPEKLKTGQKFPAYITEAVQSREKMLIVLSKHSLKSDWVKKEVGLARQKEGNGKREVLLPVCLDNAHLNSPTDWAAAIRKQRHIKSFENWQQPSRYQEMLKGLLNDLLKE
jgi:TIR domain/Pentapeptide repeats (8 copies)